MLAGGGATDDPEGKAVLDEVLEAAGDDPDIHVLLLPPDAHRTINALQRLADIVIQKSTREGFGLTVTEGMWKGKPVIGGDTGGIRLQVVNHHTGFLVNTPEGAAHRIRYLLHNRARHRGDGSERAGVGPRELSADPASKGIPDHDAGHGGGQEGADGAGVDRRDSLSEGGEPCRNGKAW